MDDQGCSAHRAAPKRESIGGVQMEAMNAPAKPEAAPAREMPAKREIEAQLGIRKGSKAIPLLLLLVTTILFVVYSLPPGLDQVADKLGIAKPASGEVKLQTIVDAVTSDAQRAQFEQKFKDLGVGGFVSNFLQPLAKAYLDQLIEDLTEIATNIVTTAWQLSLYALVPGLAGLIYRRNFWTWFLVAFAVLLAVNSSGFGSIATAKSMPLSGEIFFLLASQVILLLLANRLRRHASNSGLVPPRLHNGLLAALLVFVAVACIYGWGPGRTAAKSADTTAAATPVQKSEGARDEAQRAGRAPSQRAPSRAPSSDAQPSEPTQAAPASEPQNAADPAATASRRAPDAPASPSPGSTPSSQPTSTQNSGPPAGTASDTTASTELGRSWIWAFLGDGFWGWVYKWEFVLIGLPLIYTLLRNSAYWSGRTPKNIVVCLDGTSNTPDQFELGLLAQTNVFKLFRMLKADKRGSFIPTGRFDASLCKIYDNKQVAFYFTGVGNRFDNDPITQTLGMAAGIGASGIVERAYLDVMRVYRPGDRVFIFGFSRGAAIARLLARAIDARGAPRSVWTLRLMDRHWTVWTSRRKHKAVPIDVLGCWDTVGSFGLAKTIAGINFQQMNMFKDLTVPENVRRAYHMVALDEMRDSFEPTLMDPDPITPERITEVWFSGDHANVGGGWATDRLSDVTLDFLLRHISSGYARDATATAGEETWGIYLSAANGEAVADAAAKAPGAMVLHPDPLGQLRSWSSMLYTYRPRKLPLHAVISEAVFERMTKTLPVYAPQSLFDHNDELDRRRDTIEAKVAKLVETDSLSEDERTAIIAFKGKLRMTRWPQYLESLMSRRPPPTPPRQLLSNEVHGIEPPPTWIERRLGLRIGSADKAGAAAG